MVKENVFKQMVFREDNPRGGSLYERFEDVNR